VPPLGNGRAGQDAGQGVSAQQDAASGDPRQPFRPLVLQQRIKQKGKGMRGCNSSLMQIGWSLI